MKIRKFRDSDAVELAELHSSTVRNVNCKDYPEKQIDVWSKQTSAEKFRKSAKEATIFVALEEEKIVAFAKYKGEELLALYVDKNFLRKGIGGKLLAKVEKDALKNGIKKFLCNSTITAHEFYEKCGYNILKKTIFEIENEKLTVFKMKKTLIWD